MDVIKMFYDIETTSLDSAKGAIHEIAGEIEVNGETAEEFYLRMKPFEGAEISKAALKTCDKTIEQLMKYQSPEKAFEGFLRMISKYVNPYDKTSKIFMLGFNNARFDDPWMRIWFQRNHNKGFDAYFWSHAVDVIVLAGEYLLDRRSGMPNFKLPTVAEELGIVIERDRLHEAGYDIYLTKKIYNIVTGREMEW